MQDPQNPIRNFIAPDAEDSPIPLPDPSERKTLFEEAIREAHRHKWIESEKAGRDLGDGAVRDWHKRYWRGFVRERWMEHLQGVTFWIELDNGDFGLLLQRFHDNIELVERITERLKHGGENLDVIQWSVGQGMDTDEVLAVLKILDINSRRLAPAIAVDEEEFVQGMNARHHPRVLIVDDDADTRSLLAELFQAEGMETVAVESGEEALEETQSRRFDLFVIDIMLPGKHGAEVAWYLRRHGVSAPVVAVSAILDTWNEDDLLDCGFSRLMGKPFDIDDLRLLAREVVDAIHEK